MCICGCATADDRVIEVFPVFWIWSKSCWSCGSILYCNALIDSLTTVNVDAFVHILSAFPHYTSDGRLKHTIISWSWTRLLCPHNAPWEMLRFQSHRILRCCLSVAVIFRFSPFNNCLVFAWLWSNFIFLLLENRVNIEFSHFVSWLSEITPAWY